MKWVKKKIPVAGGTKMSKMSVLNVYRFTLMHMKGFLDAYELQKP